MAAKSINSEIETCHHSSVLLNMVKEPKGSIQDFNMYPRTKWKLLLVLGEGENGHMEEQHNQICIFGKFALGGV